MSSRRQSTVKPTRDTADEVPKTVELEHRLSRLEMVVKELVQTISTQTKRNTAMQAQLDHILAKLTGH